MDDGGTGVARWSGRVLLVLVALYLLARASHDASAAFHAQLRAEGVAVPVWRVVATLSGAAGGETVGAR